MKTISRTAICAIRERGLAGTLALSLLLLLGACEGDTGPAGPAGPEGPPGPGGGGGTDPDPDTKTDYAVGESVPTLVARIDGVSGASGPNGEFLVGDVVTVDFALEKANGDPWKLEELDEGEAMVSGPTTNYQRVLPAEVDLPARASKLAAGHFRFTFPSGLPVNYPPPLNDSTSSTAGQGELTGRPLRDGTYTVGLSFTWDYTAGGRPYRRVGEATLDFLLGAAPGALTARAVTSEQHCDRCHGELQAHDGRYRKLAVCLLCHTSGAEDANLPAVANGTPGVSIDSRVLFHKLHVGRFLPSVNGVGSRGNGSRNYAVPPVPLRYARASGELRDFSHVGFPAFPNRSAPMPRDTGFSALTPEQQAKEDTMLAAPTQCSICHGDPDGAGPLETPAQANLHTVPSRRACGACHDDLDFTNSYRSNNQTMPPQPNDNGCNACHDSRFPNPLSPVDGHVHPELDPAFNPGLNVAFTDFVESGANDADGTLDAGEGVTLEIALSDDAGHVVVPADVDELHVVLAGPSTNPQVVYDAAVPLALVSGAQPFELVLPERVQLEFLGDSTANLDVFQSARFPHRLAPGITTDVFVRTGTTGGASALAAARAAHDNFVDVFDPSGFAANDALVLDDGVGGSEEYARVQFVDGPRLWLASELRGAHPAGASVLEVQLASRAAPFQYTLEASTGTIREVAEFGEGNAVLVSYTCNWVLPSTYPQAPNGSPELDDKQGKWSGKTLVAGTYGAAVSIARDFEFRFGTSVTNYRASSPGATRSFLVGDATTLEPRRLILDGQSCNQCHQELEYHGTYKGFDTCILCHGDSGTEDLPRRVAPDAPETRGLSVEFRTLVHKIHRGRELVDDSYLVVGRGTAAFPDNFKTHAYDQFSTLPAFPNRTLECARCHGEDNPAALVPAEREHPTQQDRPLQIWRPACATCHDDDPVTAHIESNIAPNGGEACAICHAVGEFEDTLFAHLGRSEPH
jgi:hypothetical protein